MDDQRRERLGVLLEQALALPRHAQEEFLHAECAGDAALLAELRSLVVAAEPSSGYFDALAAELGARSSASMEVRAAALDPGARVAHYEILQHVGEGGMGVVYKARDLRLARLVALKFLPSSLIRDETARARLLAEARAASALDHPNIGVVHEIGETEPGGVFIAMAWYEGETLKQRLQRGPLPIDEALAFATQIGSALSAAHVAAIIHRDVKPSNIVVTRQELPKLVDFGIAKVAGVEMTKEGTTLGTIAYMSPEQTRGAAVDPRTDLWSLGVVLYEMLSGQRPFRGESEQTVIHAIRHDDPQPLLQLRPDVPEALAQVVERCLAKLPTNRHPSADDLLDDLRRVRRGERAHAVPRLRRSTWAALVAAGLVLFAAGAAYRAATSSVAPSVDADRVVVARFENLSGDASLDALGSIAADWLIQSLAHSRLVQVVPVTAALTASRLTADSATVSDPAERIRRLSSETGAGIVVAGAYSRQGDSLYFWATVTDATRDRMLHAVEPFAMPQGQPLHAVERMRERLLGGLAPHLNPRMRDHATRPHAPPTYEAYRAFAEGLETFIARDWRGATLRFSEATARDSNFAPAYIYAGMAHLNIGNMPGVDSILQIVRPRLAQLSETDRLAFDLLAALVRGDYVAAHQANLRTPELAPGTLAHWGRANSAMWVNRPRETIRVSHQLDPERGELRDWYFYWRDLGRAHHRVGDHRSELRVAREARTRFPDELQTVWREARALAALGRHRELRTVLAEQGGKLPNAAMVLRQTGQELLAHGATLEGHAVLRASLEAHRARPRDIPGYRLFLAEAHALVDEHDEGERILRALVAELPDSWQAHGALGALIARRGDTAEAERIAAWLAAVDRPWLRGRHTYLRARIAAQLGRRDEAVQLLRQAFTEGVEVWDMMHMEPDFAPLRDFPAYREFARPTG